ncbi:hypothetical protein FBALC1_05133 [Flavobacteriales bacterium ALC-1]|nr:hypothetical protein FBALC1_05133 [Flavobacteriales bacterium ALC-1]
MRILKEEQRFNQTWLIILILVSMIMPLGIILGTYIKDTSSFSIQELVLIIGSILLFSGLIFIFKLKSRIDEIGIHYKFFPFHFSSKVIPWHEINKAYIRKYDAISEYGGWGLKGGLFFKKNNGKAISVSGDIGIQLELKNGKKLLIGTQKQEDVKNILNTYKTKIKNNV